jgi:hypothetical protein
MGVLAMKRILDGVAYAAAIIQLLLWAFWDHEWIKASLDYQLLAKCLTITQAGIIFCFLGFRFDGPSS